MEQRRTDRDVLKKGIIRLAQAVPLFFLGPYVLTLSFLNKENMYFWVFLIPAVIACIGAVTLFFIGINTCLKAFFGKSY